MQILTYPNLIYAILIYDILQNPVSTKLTLPDSTRVHIFYYLSNDAHLHLNTIMVVVAPKYPKFRLKPLTETVSKQTLHVLIFWFVSGVIIFE